MLLWNIVIGKVMGLPSETSLDFLVVFYPLGDGRPWYYELKLPILRIGLLTLLLRKRHGFDSCTVTFIRINMSAWIRSGVSINNIHSQQHVRL
jgi:hypothetical protein